MAALISSVMSTKDRVPFYVGECADMGIEVLPPDVNSSQSDFAVVDGKIRFGLAAVKRVGEGAVRAIIAARSERPFDSIWDFCERVDMAVLNRGMVESLIACGAFDSTGATRRGMFEVLEQAISAGQRTQSDALVGQGSIFDLGRRGRQRRRARRAAAARRCRRRSGRATSSCGARRRCSGCTSRAIRSPRSATSSRARSTRRCGRSRTCATARS